MSLSPPSPSSSPSSFQAPTRLLQKLERDWGSIVSKQSIKDCLRSKAKICPQVKSVLQEREKSSLLNEDEIMRSFHAVKDCYMGWIKSAAAAAVVHDTTRSSLWYVSRCGTIIRFLELLLELKPESPHGNENAAPNLTVDESQISKMVLELLRTLTASMCASIESAFSVLGNESEDPNDIFSSDITEDTPDASHLAFFCLGSLIRLNNRHVRAKPYLLSPLWKGLCDIAQATKRIPKELVRAAVKALVDHIQDGVDQLFANSEHLVQQQPSDTNNHSQITLCTKILGFLLMRLGVFLSFGLDDPTSATESSLVMQVLQILFRLSGISDAMDRHLQQVIASPDGNSNHHPISKAFKQISSKAEKSFTCWFWALPKTDHNQETAAASGSLLNQLASAANKSDSHWETNKIATDAYIYGMTCILIKALEDSTLRESQSFWSSDDVNALLQIMEELFLRSLPLCNESSLLCYCSSRNDNNSSNSLLPRCISASVAVLISCETRSVCIATNANPGRAPLHFLLTKWLSAHSNRTKQHPLTREVVLTVLHLYAVGLCRVGGIDDVTPFLTLLTKLLFDIRTTRRLRTNIGACLSRMLQCSEKRIRRCLTSLLSKEQQFLMKQLSPSPRSRKRKRGQRSRMPGAADLDLISSVLLKAGPSDGNTPHNEVTIPLNDQALLSKRKLAYVTFKGVIAPDPLSEEHVTKTITTFCKGWASKKRKSDSSLADRLSFMGIVASRQVYSICNDHKGDLSDNFLAAVCQLIGLCSSDSLVARCGQSDSSPSMNRLPLEAIQVLSTIGRAVLPSTAKTHLQRLAGIFKRLLSHPDWTMRSYTMSSLVLFASTIPASHQSILPTCLPPGMQSLLQQRLQCSSAGSPEQLSVVQSYACQMLLKTVPRLNRRRSSMLVAPHSISVASGSLIMHMPTQEGRSALVIFPPGEQSLDDIHFMLGVDPDVGDTEKPDVLEVRGAVLAKDGACRLLVR